MRELDDTDPKMRPAIAMLRAKMDVAQGLYAAKAGFGAGRHVQVPGAGTLAEALEWQADLQEAQELDGTDEAAAAAAANPPRPPSTTFLCDLADAEFIAKRNQYYRNLVAKYPEVAGKVEDVLSLASIVKQVLDAHREKQQRPAGKRWKSKNRQAETTHLVLINGDIQRGKTNIKLAKAIIAEMINNDREVLDRCYTIWITVQVPWAQQAKQSIERATKGARPLAAASSDDEVESDDDSESAFEGNEQQLREIIGDVGGIPCSFCTNEANFREAKEVAAKGGIIVIARTVGQIQKAIRLKTELGEEAAAQGKPAFWPFIALDEVDRMLGSCNTAGYDNDQDIKVTKYEQYLFVLCGFADADRGHNVPFKEKDGQRMRERRISADAHKPCLVTAISATNCGTFLWALHRIGALTVAKSGRPARECFNLLDVLSMKEADEGKYISLLDAMRFKGLTFMEKDICPRNNFVCDKTIAIESDAAQTPGACIMVATTPTVNETARRGVSQMRVHASAITELLIGGALGSEAAGQQVGLANAGMTTVYMHGGAKSFDGQLGIEYSSPSDPFGLGLLTKFRDAANKARVDERNKMRADEDELDALKANAANLSEAEQDREIDLKANVTRRKRMVEDLQAMSDQLTARIQHSRSQRCVPTCQRLLDSAIDKYRQAKAARIDYDHANAVQGDARQSPLEIEALEAKANLLAGEADEGKELAARTRIEEAAYSGEGVDPIFRKAFVIGVEILRPLIMLWEEEQARHNPAYVKCIGLPQKRKKNSNEWSPSMRASCLQALLGFLRTFDDSAAMRQLYSDGTYQQPTGDLHSLKVPVKVMGMGMLRRCMSVVGVNETGEHGMVPVLTITHVEQYSGHDGASQAQQTQRFCTTLTEYIRDIMGDESIKVLTTELGWLGMKGHRAYNALPLFKKPDCERRDAIEHIKDCVRGKTALPVYEDQVEASLDRICAESYEVKKNVDADLTERNERVIRVLAVVLEIPDELYAMCACFKNALFAGSAGKDLSQVLMRAAVGKREIEGRAPPRRLVPEKKPKKKTRARSMLPDWVFEALIALNAKCATTGPYDAAVVHGDVWQKLIDMQKWRLDDPVEKARIEEVQPAVLKVLVKDRSGQAGGVGHRLDQMSKQGRIVLIKRDNPVNKRGKNLYFIPTDAPDASMGDASAAGPSALGKRALLSVAVGGPRRRVRAVAEDSEDEALFGPPPPPKGLAAPRRKRRAVIEDEESEDEEMVPQRQVAQAIDFSESEDSEMPAGDEDDGWGDEFDDSDYAYSVGPSSDVDDDEALFDSSPSDMGAAEREAADMQQAIIQSHYEMRVAQLAKGNTSLAARGFSQVDPAHLHPRLPPGWTQWRKERPDGRLCDLFVSPDGSFETDLMQSNGNGKGKIGVYDYMADQQ